MCLTGTQGTDMSQMDGRYDARYYTETGRDFGWAKSPNTTGGFAPKSWQGKAYHAGYTLGKLQREIHDEQAKGKT